MKTLDDISNEIVDCAISKGIESVRAKIGAGEWVKSNEDGSLYQKWIGDFLPIGQRPYGPEGFVFDVDGEGVSVIVYVDSKFNVFEIEFIKNSGEVIDSVNLDSFVIPGL